MIDQAADISHIFAMAGLVNGNFAPEPSTFHDCLTLPQPSLLCAMPRFSFPVLSAQTKQYAIFINSAVCYSTQ